MPQTFNYHINFHARNWTKTFLLKEKTGHDGLEQNKANPKFSANTSFPSLSQTGHASEHFNPNGNHLALYNLIFFEQKGLES